MDNNGNKHNINLWIASKEYKIYQLIIMAIHIARQANQTIDNN